MPDFGETRDMQAVTSFTDAAAEFDFGFLSTSQATINESAIVLELSWDKENVHGILDPSATAVLTYDDHARKKVYVRRQGAPGGGPHNIQVVAGTR